MSLPQMESMGAAGHRFNRLLPESYRDTLGDEARRQLACLRVVAESIGEGDDGEQDCNESYERQAEMDLAALEKGLSRYLDVKYLLEPADFNLFVQACVRGILTEDIDLGLRAKLARTTVRLLRKRTCELSFALPWRKIRDLIVKVHIDCADGSEYVGKDVRDAHCRNLIALLRKCRNYLEEDDGAERIWGELGTKIDPSQAISAFEPLLILNHILPTRGDAWHDWLDQAADLWQTLETSLDWDTVWLGLMARLAKNQPLAVDWTPYLRIAYERIPNSFRLPLGSAAPQSPVERRSPAHCCFLLTEKLTISAATFCAYTLTPRSSDGMSYFRRLIALVANYFHPSNGGRWSSYLASFLGHLTAMLTTRVALEKSATEAGVMERVLGSNTQKAVAPFEDRLTDELIAEVVELLLPLVQLGLHAKNGYMSVQAAASARDLAAIAPSHVVGPMLEAAASGLASISLPHRTSAALKMLATLTPVFLDAKICPNGIESLPQALELTLPGIDPNDPIKTEATFRFIAGASARLQALLSDRKDSDVAIFLEEYAHQLLDRVFALLDALEAPPKKNKNGSSASSASVLSPFIFSVAMENFFGAVPPAVATKGAEMIARQISGAASANALKFYGILVRASAAAAAGASNSSSAGIFIPLLLNQVVEKEKGEMVLASLSDEELLWRFRMLAQACRSCGDVTGFSDRLLEASLLAMQHSSRGVYKSGARLLRGLLEGLTAGKIQFGAGSGDDVDDADQYEVHWWQPGEAEWTEAERIVRKSLEFANSLLRVDGTIDLSDREKVFKGIRALHATQRGGRWLASGALTDRAAALIRSDRTDFSKADAKFVLAMPLHAGLGGELGEKRDKIATAVWRDVYSTILEVVLAIERERPNDSALLYRCLEPIELAHEPFRRSTQGRMTAHAARGYKTAYKPVMAMKREFHAEGGVGRMMPRFIMKLRVEALHELRLGLGARGGYACDDIFLNIMESLNRMALNDFPKVRAEARAALTKALRVANRSVRKEQVQTLVGVLEKASIPDNDKMYDYERMMGAADVLRSSSLSPYIMREWGMFRIMALAVLKAMPAAERPDAAAVVGGLFAKLASLIRPIGIVPLQLVGVDFEAPPTGSGDAPVTPQMKEYEDLNQALVAMVKNDSSRNGTNGSVDTHWRLQSLVATTLYTNLRESHAPSTQVATFFAESMASDLLSLRQASKKAVSLILALNRKKTRRTPADDEAMKAIETVFQREGFPQKLLETLALDESTDVHESGLADGSMGVFSLLSLAKHVDGDACWALVGGRPWPASWVPRSRDSLIITRVRLIETIFYSYGSPMLKLFKEPIESLINKEDPISGVTKENARVLAAEVVAGACRGLPLRVEGDETLSASEQDLENLATWTKDLLEAFSGHEGMVNGGTMLRLLVSSEPDRAAKNIVSTIWSQIFEPPLIEADATAHIQARRLRYIHACLADENPRHTQAPVDKVMPLLMDPETLAHRFKHVREEIARCLSLLSSFTSDAAKTVYMECVKRVVEHMKKKSDSTDDEEDEEEKKTRSRENDTLSRWVSVVHWNGDTFVFGDYFCELLPCLFASLDDSDQERTSHSRLALSLAAQAKLNQTQIDRVIEACEEAARNRRWRIRGAVLPFLQVLAFSRLFIMDNDRLARIRAIVIELLSDEQLEVREAATHTLVPLIRDAPVEAIKETRSLLTARLEKTRPKSRKKSRTQLDSTVLRERHSAVLGLSSMVMSSPYSVPEWMPQVLVSLTRCIDDPAPISTSARKLFAEFWRTHRDEWDTLKHNFNEDELETVSELLISPSYYA